MALWHAFYELSTERPGGMGVGQIPRSKIREFLKDELGLDGEAQDDACAILRQVDDAYVAMVNSPNKTDENVRDIVKPTDTVGVKQLMRRLGKPHKAHPTKI